MGFQLKLADKVFILNKDKITVGRDQASDIYLNDEFISPLHAVLYINHENQTIKVQDLHSLNGIFLNGIKVANNADILVGDQLSFGKTHFELEESVEDGHELLLDDTKVLETISETMITLPPKDSDHLQLIDDEYCDIIFDDQTVQDFDQSSFSFTADNYIETETVDQPFEISKETDGLCIKVTTAINGVILEQYQLPLKDQTINFTGSSKKNHLVLETLGVDSLPVFKVENGNIQLLENTPLKMIKNDLNQKEGSIHLKCGICQVFVEITDAPSELENIPFWARNKEFWKKSGAQTAASFACFLLLLLVDITVPKKEKKLAIIYKKPLKTEKNDQKLASKETNQDKKPGQKKQEVNKKVAHLKKGVKKQVKAKTTPKKVAAKPKPKKLMKLNTSLASLASPNSKQVNVQRSPASVSNMQTASVADTSISKSANLDTGKMGLDSIGGAQSYGTKGLASKGPRETAYVQTKTVVLGSMDPELLRKILEQYLPQFRHCYQQELAYNSDDIKGVVDLDFEISKVGKVGKINIKAKDSRFSQKGINCMSKVLAIISFPKPKGGGRVAVRQPLNFFAEQENS